MRHVSAQAKRLLHITFWVVAAIVVSTTTTEAQGFRRHGYRSRVVLVGGYYANPFWYADPWFAYQYPWGYPPPYRYYGFDEASVRIEVMPREAEVYVDGYYAGIADDFDGAFQRLRVEPGEHEIEIYLEGHKPFRQKVYLTHDHTFRIRQRLQPLAPGEQPEARPEPSTAPATAQGAQAPGNVQPPPGTPPMTRGPAGRRMPPPRQGPQGPDPRGQIPDPREQRGAQAPSAYGTISIRVQPADAEVSIDGEPWRGPGGASERLVIEVAEGSHTVEIRKPGFRTYVTQVEIRRGETLQVNVSLRNE
jgi:hypothetical protein